MTGDDAAGTKQAAASGPRSQSQRMVKHSQQAHAHTHNHTHKHKANITRYKGSSNPPQVSMVSPFFHTC